MTDPPRAYHLGLIGYPLEHSLSPKLHNAALRALGLAGEYRLYPVPSTGAGERELRALLEQMRAGEIHGLNVTIPHKRAVIPLLDELTPTAQAIAAVNTIIPRGGKLIGDNTDAPGFLADLYRAFPSLRPAHPVASPKLQAEGADLPHAFILGAGGSARAVAYALLQDGWQLTIAARRPAQARSLVKDLAPYARQASVIRPATFDFRPAACDLIVNCTPLGMSPNVEASPWPEDVPFPQGAAVYDLVYNPRETRLVAAARAAGLPAVTGLGMLIEQAALAFEHWVGQYPPGVHFTPDP